MSNLYDAMSQVAPAVEDQEMGKVREIFDRALNALVDASALAKTVEQLKTDLEGLKVQVTHYRNTISNQDDQITRLRQDRDAARTAQYQAEDSVRHMTTDLENTKRDLSSMAEANVRLNDRLSAMAKEKDDAQFQLLELQEVHAALSKKMDTIRDLFGVAVAKPPESVYVPEPAPVIDWPKVAEPVPPSEPPEPTPPASWPQDIR